MKTVLVLMTLLVISFTIIAQNTIIHIKIDNKDDKNLGNSLQIMDPEFSFHNQQFSSRENSESGWYAFPLALNHFIGGNLPESPYSVFPDSFPVLVYTDAKNHAGVHSVGAAFDPADETWATYEIHRLLPRQNYTIDSIGFHYYYFKHNDNDIKDELVIQFCHTTKITPLVLQSTPPQPVATVAFDSSTLSATDFHHQIKYELDYKDTVEVPKGFYRYKWLSLPVNLSVPKTAPTGRNIALATVTFKPKYSYNFADTLHAYDTLVTPFNKLNSFFFRVFRDESAYKLTYYNNGLINNRQSRYYLFPQGNLLNGKYIPGSGFNSHLYPYIAFKITYDKDYVESINDAENSFKVTKVYPNPVSGKANLEVSLENTANVRVDLLNTLGQLVHTMNDAQFNSGNHQISINTSDMQTGVYILRVVVNGVPTTQSLIIQ